MEKASLTLFNRVAKVSLYVISNLKNVKRLSNINRHRKKHFLFDVIIPRQHENRRKHETSIKLFLDIKAMKHIKKIFHAKIEKDFEDFSSFLGIGKGFRLLMQT